MRHPSQYEEFVRWIEQNSDRFYRMAWRYTHNEERAMDVVQEAIVRSLERWDSLREPAAARSWFYRVLTHTAIDAIRRDGREAPAEDEVLTWQADRREDAPGFEGGVALHDAIDRLPPNLRTVILLHHFEDLTLPEIAGVLGCGLSAVKYRYYTALARLRQEWDTP